MSENLNRSMWPARELFPATRASSLAARSSTIDATQQQRFTEQLRVVTDAAERCGEFGDRARELFWKWFLDHGDISRLLETERKVVGQILGDAFAEDDSLVAAWFSVKAIAPHALPAFETAMRGLAQGSAFAQRSDTIQAQESNNAQERGIASAKQEPDASSNRPMNEQLSLEPTSVKIEAPAWRADFNRQPQASGQSHRRSTKPSLNWIGAGVLVIATLGVLAWNSTSKALPPSATIEVRRFEIATGAVTATPKAMMMPRDVRSESKEVTAQNAIESYNRGSALFDEGRYDEAIAAYDMAIASKPDFAVAFNDRASAHASQGRDDRAIADYDRAIALKPDFADALDSRGMTYAHKGDYHNAIADFDRAISLKADFAEAYFHRGQAYSMQRRFADAVQSYNRAIAIKPDYAEALLSRGRDRISGGDGGGTNDIARATKLDPWLH